LLNVHFFPKSNLQPPEGPNVAIIQILTSFAAMEADAQRQRNGPAAAVTKPWMRRKDFEVPFSCFGKQ